MALAESYKDIEDLSNRIIYGDTLSILKKFPDESIDLIITSPSYYLGKKYEDYDSFDHYLDLHKQIIFQSKRILKSNGAIFWNVAQTLLDKDKKEVTPLGAIFYNIFKEFDFYLKNWIIWKFNGGETPKSRLFGRYENVLWFTKDKYDYKFNLDDIRIPSKWVNDKRCNIQGKNPEDFWEFDFRTNREKLIDLKKYIVKLKNVFSKNLNQSQQIFLDEELRDIEIKLKNILNSENDFIKKNLSNNIWYINRVTNNNKKEKIKHPKNGCTHPCPFPEEMIKRIIKMASDEKDTILDIFMGSGTACKVAEDLNRNWIGIEKSEDYCEIAKIRVESALKKKNQKKIEPYSKKTDKQEKTLEKEKKDIKKFQDITKGWS